MGRRERWHRRLAQHRAGRDAIAKIALGLRLAALSPVALALLLYVFTPTYFRPMLGSVVGWLLLSVFATTVFICNALAQDAISLFRKSRAVLGGAAVVGVCVTWLVSAGIVVLGPAALILMRPR